MELGGNAPFIVFDDADLDRAVAGALASKFRNAGQTCVCANRILVQDGVYDAFAGKLADAVKELKVGAGTEAGVTVGPLINKDAIKKVERARRRRGGEGRQGRHRRQAGTRSAATSTSRPCSTGVTPQMRVAREETFGPVAPLFRFKTEEEAVAHGQRHPVRPRRLFLSPATSAACWRVAEALEYGIVGVNEGIISTEIAPFGGIKESGIGREGSHHGIEEFLEIKYTLMGGL